MLNNLRASFSNPAHRSRWVVFGVLFAVGLAWSVITQHVWEDFYITYRASKNLATGLGLTFTEGERVHSFTSPLGTLLPALASLLTANSSDTAALWIFRLMSIAAYAGAGVLLWCMARRLFAPVYPAVFLIILFATDAKSIDCTTNGMETGILLLFLAWMLYALFCVPSRQWLHLGLAWAGLMWTRPDSFIYIGALGIGVWLFGKYTPFFAGRWAQLKTYLLAGGVTTALYLPWLLWAWWYYGSPVPHTVIAKGSMMPKPTFPLVLQWLGDFPFNIARTGGNLATTFMPPYGTKWGWPEWAIQTSFWLSLAVLVVWLIPFFRREARIASFGFTVGHFYLTYFANYYYPWYIPTITLLAFITLAGVVDDIARWTSRRKAAGSPANPVRWPIVATSALIPLGASALSISTGQQVRIAQSICETGNRQLVGEWLKANARSPKDTVLLECLGYIGFFSNLKIYDFPGLASPEVVAARKKSKIKGDYTLYFPELMLDLHPDWVVLRKSERAVVSAIMPELLTEHYQLAKVFDIGDKLAAVKFLPGRALLEFDSRFEVYRRNWDPAQGAPRKPSSLPVLVGTLVRNETWVGPAQYSDGKILAHAPSILVAKIPPGTKALSSQFGFFPGAYESPHNSTPGAVFMVNVVSASGVRTPLFAALINPREVAEHRPPQAFRVNIPPEANADLVEFVIEPPAGKGNAFGWTYWAAPKFELQDPAP